jgi:hypothetical protein
MNISYHSVQNLWCFDLLCTHMNIIICRTLTLFVDLCGYVTWCSTLREDYGHIMFEIRVLLPHKYHTFNEYEIYELKIIANILASSQNVS